jgi:ATP-dependent helicase/DNAse subunit B
VRIDPRRRGSLFHRIFQRFHQEWSGGGPAALAAEAEQRMRAIAQEECAHAEARGETGYAAMWAADRLEVIDDCLQWLALERQDPLTKQLPLGAYEARFGNRHPGEQVGALSRDDPIAIPLAKGTLLLSGRIDRINWDRDPPSRFRVLDYKTGRVYDERPAQLQGGRMLQLPLYVLAGAQLLEVEPSAGEAAYVFPTRKGQFRQIPWEREQLTERHGEVLSLLGKMLGGIARGDFMIAPWDHKKACRYCDMNLVCPVGRDAFLKRKQGDVRLARFGEEIRSIE